MVAQSAAPSTSPAWLMDTGANSDLTHDLGNLSLANDYRGHDQVGGVLNGTGLSITHIGQSSVSSPTTIFAFTDVLHCLQSSSHLISVNKFARDNRCFFTFDPSYFLIQDLETGTILFRGKSENGLYIFFVFIK